MPSSEHRNALIAWLPELIYAGDGFQRDMALVCDGSGRIVRLAPSSELGDEKRIRLANRAMLPGMVNAHSHAFQRVLRGRTEYRTTNQADSFWTWREMMYSAATRLTAEDIYDASRMAFLEMALSGITAVGEFHYLHHAPDGQPYDDPNLLAKEVIRAANDIGLRIALLRVAYARSGFQTEPNPKQTRFIETEADIYLKNLETLICNVGSVGSSGLREGSSSPDSGALRHGWANAPHASAWIGVAPHSVRAVPLDYLRRVIGYAHKFNLKVHMHVAEQPAEVSACVAEYGRSPIALLQTEGLLSKDFTAVHAIHVTTKAVASFAKTGAMVCACPTTERNLGDGVVPADEYFKNGVQVCLGTDSQVQIDLLEDARELEYHLRLQKLERAVLDRQPRGISPTNRGPKAGSPLRVVDREGSESEVARDGPPLAARLFDCATIHGARSIGAPNGSLEIGNPADFFTVDLNNPSIVGVSPSDLLTSVVFSSSRAAIREVVVGGKPIVSEGQHLIQDEVIERFNTLQEKLWS